MQMSGPPSIPHIADQCFEELATHVDNQGQVAVEHLARLHLLLGRNFQKALQVVDQNEVECFQAQTSGRRIFQVKGKTGQYVTFAKTYCSCQAHYYEVVSRAEAPYCKHQLAARLALVLKRCPVTYVPDTALAEFLLQA
eukprot:GHUV01007473.1.p2 GENE.GHUV01007473.1~~GHUV01007473.1.p2  ORF type:complete len:139 (+),score=23.19 GHUV01007473.1:150-566(+)